MLGALVAAFGILALIGLTQTNEVCSGEVVDTILCEAAQTRQSIFGGLVGMAMIISATIIAGACLIAEQLQSRREDVHDPATGGVEMGEPVP